MGFVWFICREKEFLFGVNQIFQKKQENRNNRKWKLIKRFLRKDWNGDVKNIISKAVSIKRVHQNSRNRKTKTADSFR